MNASKGFVVLAVAGTMFGCASAKKTWKEQKTVLMPECSVAISRTTQGTGFSNRFKNTGLSSTMVVMTPFENPALYQEIADTSCERLQSKISALGYKVVTGADLAEKSEKYRELQKDLFTKEPDVREQLAYFGYSKTGVPKGGMGFSLGMGYGSMTRNTEGILITPSMVVAFGSVEGSGDSVTDSNGLTTASTSTRYNPLVTVTKERTLMTWMTSEKNGFFDINKDISDNSVPWLINIVKGDTKVDAISAVGAVLLGSRENRSTYYTMQVDEAQMKEAILKQTDLAENELVAQIKELIKE